MGEYSDEYTPSLRGKERCPAHTRRTDDPDGDVAAAPLPRPGVGVQQPGGQGGGAGGREYSR